MQRARPYSAMHNFDTYKFVQRLEAESFSRDASEAIMNSLAEVLSESVNGVKGGIVSKSDFERSLYAYRVDFQSLRNEIALLEKNDFASLKADLNRLLTEVEKLRTRMKEDLNNVQSNVRLELSLEKGRIRDEQSVQEIKIKEAESRIDAEVSNVKTNMEMIKWEMFRTLIPLFFTGSGLLIGYLRFLK